MELRARRVDRRDGLDLELAADLLDQILDPHPCFGAVEVELLEPIAQLGKHALGRYPLPAELLELLGRGPRRLRLHASPLAQIDEAVLERRQAVAHESEQQVREDSEPIELHASQLGGALLDPMA